MMSREANVPILIIGGGIGGLAAAHAIAQRGLPVHVLEQAPEFGEIGAGIQLAPNALRALDQLGVLDGVYANAVYPPQAVLMDAVTGKQLTALDFGEKFRETYGYPYIVTHRSDLLTSLLRACRADELVTLETDKQVQSIEEESGTVRVSCEDGTVYDAGAVVGADGLWSTVRQYTVGDGDPMCVQDVAYRATVPYDDISERPGKDNMTWWCGPKMHLVQYPLRRREIFNLVAVFTSDHYQADSDEWGTTEELDERFAGKISYVQEGVELINRDRRWILHDREPVDNWTRDRVTLLGDAAHPMVQYLAQGACQALEDAIWLAASLEAHPDDVEEAFAMYQQERIPHTANAQRWARLMGDIVHIDGVGAMMRDELLRQRADDDFTYVDWLYGYSLPSLKS
jgi:2-polyprenyl-6-methoxyphenol hydroxylase-like FAD-dependent oxidoreductase